MSKEVINYHQISGLLGEIHFKVGVDSLYPLCLI